ncbi:MAG TPA: DM13 domain-containing protein [Acidimicrobiales bacterium]|nr:DM13 domain-containing protein [Acidimicrobiales bacterium]
MGAVGVLVAAVLAFGVFEVQALFTDDEVAEAGPVFESGAVAPTGPIGPGGEEGDATEPAPSIPPAVPEVTVASSGTFVEKGHPGEGTARILTDGAQAFVRFEDDFATDNGPDLRVRALVDGEQVDLGVLKGNRGAQNYELPAHIDPTAVTSVDVWCRRFDYVFTEAALS